MRIQLFIYVSSLLGIERHSRQLPLNYVRLQLVSGRDIYDRCSERIKRPDHDRANIPGRYHIAAV